MKAVWYEENGAAADVLNAGEMPADEPQSGELRIRLHASGVNPSDVKNRAGLTRKLALTPGASHPARRRWLGSWPVHSKQNSPAAGNLRESRPVAPNRAAVFWL